MLRNRICTFFLIFILLILLISSCFFEITYALDEQVPNWFPNITFTLVYEGYDEIESLFSNSDRVFYQSFYSSGSFFSSFKTYLSNTKKIATLSSPKFSLSDLTRIDEENKVIWTYEKSFEDIIYIIDPNNGTISCNPFYFNVYYSCYSYQNEPIKYSLSIFDENHLEYFSVSEKTKEELYNIISISNCQLNASDFNKGQISIKKEKNEELGYINLEATFVIYKKGGGQISLYKGDSISDSYDNCYYYINPHNGNGLESSFNTDSNGYLNLIGLPIGTYIVKQTYSPYIDEELKEYEVTIGKYGYIWDSNGINPNLIIEPIKEEPEIIKEETKEEGTNSYEKNTKDIKEEIIEEELEINEENFVDETLNENNQYRKPAFLIEEKNNKKIDENIYIDISNENEFKSILLEIKEYINTLKQIISNISYEKLYIYIPCILMLLVILFVLMIGKKNK